MIYTTVPDKAQGDVFSEAMWDTYLRDNINNLIAGPACRARRAAATTSLANDTLSILSLDVEDFDTDGMHDNATDPSRITIQTAGRYGIIGTFRLASVTAEVSIAEARILHSGTHHASSTTSKPATGAGRVVQVTVSSTMDCAVSDYFELQAYQVSGGAINITGNVMYSPVLEVFRI